MTAASVLCWPAVVRLTWMPIAVLSAGAGAAAFAVWRAGLPRPRRPGAGEAVALALLALNLGYAALPDYRYDQWNDHLVIPKAVQGGPLEGPILNDHLAFTGAWEYLFTVPRALWGDDVFNHSAANAFSWLFLAVAVLGLLRRLNPRAFPHGPATLLVLAWVLFGLPDEPGLMNAKPDPVLLVAAIVVLDLLTLPRDGRTRPDAALLAFFLVAPVGLKVTWVLFAAVAVPAAFWAWRPPWPRGTATAALGGAAAGLLVTVPYFVKNTLLFGDPFYPVQWGPFRSPFWSAAMEHYWKETMAPARSLGAWWATFERVPLGVTWHLFPVALPVLLVALLALLKRLRRTPSDDSARGIMTPQARTLGVGSLALGGGCALLWPLFFHHGIDARFVFPCLAALLVALFVVLGAAYASIAQGPRPARLATGFVTLALFLPAALYGRIPLKVERLATWPSWTLDRLARDGPEEWRLWPEMRAINRDRRERWPGAPFSAGVTLVSVHNVYLLDGASLANGGLEYLWYRERASCLWQMLSDLDVRYILLRTPGLDTLPDLRPLAPGLVPLDERGLALRVDESAVRRLRVEDPACGDHPRT